MNPYVIDYRFDRIIESDRLTFLLSFVREHYNFRGICTVNDDKNRFNLELMIYTHIWESKFFLKKLFRLSKIVSADTYHWKFDVPDMSKHDFIRKQIRSGFETWCPNMAEVIKKGFHTSLRNAFAHAEYYFSDFDKSIRLLTYKGAGWDIPSISYDSWMKRFLYSVFLNYHLHNITHDYRTSVIRDFGTSEFLIVCPKNERSFSCLKIKYDLIRDSFYFI